MIRACTACFCIAMTLAACAADWPEVHGAGRHNVWTETGILDRFPEGGLKVSWRVPIHGGYAGPAVADGRVFVGDYEKTAEGQVERLVCLAEETGEVLWTYENRAVDYGRMSYGSGPRATPTVDGERVYALGAAGDLYCVQVADGKLLWARNYMREFGARMPDWGFCGSPLVYGDRVICIVGGQNGAKLMAFNKLTGEEAWRALASDRDIDYSSPILIHAAGVDQLIAWHRGAVSSLNPLTGQVYWEHEFDGNLAVANPVFTGDRLFVSAFWVGPLMLSVDQEKPGAAFMWKGESTNPVRADKLHALMTTPIIRDGYIYGICAAGELRCLRAETGEQVWESLEAVGERARWATAFITPNADRYFINSDRGDLIIARLSPAGYEEIDRTFLVKPTSGGAGSRQAKLVNWVMPAYANRHIVIRNDEEILRASLAAE